jgi:hypothetical protein
MTKTKEKKVSAAKKPKEEKKKPARKVTKAKVPKKSAAVSVRSPAKTVKAKAHAVTVHKPEVVPQEIVKKKVIPPRKIVKKEEAAPEHKPLPTQHPVIEEVRVHPGKESFRPAQGLKIIHRKAEKPPVEEEKPLPAVEPSLEKTLEIDLPITVKDLAVKLQEKPSVLR